MNTIVPSAITPVIGHPTANRRVARIQHLAQALGMKNYLEIGVFKGSTFLQVQLPYKVGVDPHFLFDVSTVRSDAVVLAEMTSDDYFAALPITQTFDFVFLDGLHQFEQTYRDLCNALIHTHARSVIMIDDVRPSDPYSALTDQARCLQLRQAETERAHDLRWHGDVFKIVFAIHDFHPGLDYATMTDVGNPQLLLWRSKAFQRAPVFNNLEHISRMDYFDLLNHEAQMRNSNEQTAITRCLATLQE